MLKSSFLVSVLLAAAAPACHHDHPVAAPATPEPASSGMTATAEPGNTSSQSNSYNSSNSYKSSATGPGATVPGNPPLPQINDPDRTGSTPSPSGSGAPINNGTDTGSDKGDNGTQPDTAVPTTSKDTSGSNTTRRNTGKSTTSGKPRSGSNSGSNGSGSADGSGGSGSDVPR